MILIACCTGVLVTPVLLWLYSWYISAPYHPSWWCPFGSTQTVVRQVFRDCPLLPFEREIVEFEDGGAAGIDWLIPQGAEDTTPIVVFLPGITGSTHDSSYVLHPVIEARDKGWKCVVVNPRGLGGVKLRTTRTYNAAIPDDFAFIAEMIHKRFPNARKLGCGFSMGGMILWNYLAMVGDDAHLDGGMIISSPWDPMIASDSIEGFIPQLVFNSFIAKNLVAIVKPYREMFEKCEKIGKTMDFDEVLRSNSVRSFDKSFVIPIFGYDNYETYYRTAALNTKVKKIRRPVVTLNAVDDYFSPVECIPINDMEESENVVGIITNHGGHTAFMESADPNARGMVEKLLSQWGNLIFHDYH